MPNYLKGSLLFAVTTDPDNPADASAHSGGWSESHWSNVVGTIAVDCATLAQARARLLPAEVSIIGYRVENFTVTGNKLTPNGTSSGRFQYPGSNGRNLNLPQDGVLMSGSTSGAPNANRFNLRGLPDSIIQKGEYQPDPAFKGGMTNYVNTLINAQWGFLGRIKTTPSARVNSIAAGVVTLNGPVGGVANVDYLRLNRVYDNNGNPVKGTFLITDITGNAYTVQGLGATAVGAPSGSARIDALAFYIYNKVVPNRAVVRKIGRPFEQYRGRASARAR